MNYHYLPMNFCKCVVFCNQASKSRHIVFLLIYIQYNSMLYLIHNKTNFKLDGPNQQDQTYKGCVDGFNSFAIYKEMKTIIFVAMHYLVGN